METVVGIDPSLRATAVCILEPGMPAAVRTFTSKPDNGKVAGRINRYSELVGDIEYHVIDWTLGTGRDATVFIEGYSHGSKFNAAFLGEFGGLLRAVFVQECKAVIEVPPQSLKKFVTGKGNAEKSAMMMHVLKRWGHQSENDDEADAFALAKLGQAYLGIIECENIQQREVIEKLKAPKVKKRKAKAV